MNQQLQTAAQVSTQTWQVLCKAKVQTQHGHRNADTAWTQECRHNNMDTGMQTQHAWWWIVCMQASRCNAMCGVASSMCVWCCVCCAVQGCQWITLCQQQVLLFLVALSSIFSLSLSLESCTPICSLAGLSTKTFSEQRVHGKPDQFDELGPRFLAWAVALLR